MEVCKVKGKERRYGTKTKNEMKTPLVIPYQNIEVGDKWMVCITYNTEGDYKISFQKPIIGAYIN